MVIKDTEVRDENDRPVEFNSAVDALNFMSTIGYEFVQAYTMTSTSNDSIVSTVYYLLKREETGTGEMILKNPPSEPNNHCGALFSP